MDNMTTNKHKKVVVVGLGMVGITFIEKLVHRDEKQHQYDIVVLGEERHLAYNRVALTSFFEKRDADALLMNSRQWYEEQQQKTGGHFAWHINSLVSHIDQEAQTVQASDGRVFEYDFLVLATGSLALIPPGVPGVDAQGVFGYRTIADLENMMKYATEQVSSAVNSEEKRCVVVGGGLLGLEAAKAVGDLGTFDKISIVHRNTHLMSAQLDQDGGLVVTQKIRDMGPEVFLSSQITEIKKDADGRVCAVVLNGSQELPTQMVCYAIGIKPRDDLARHAGIPCHPRGGIIVDAHLESQCKNIYAVGEVANFEGNTFGLIAPGNEMADILSFNMTQAAFHKERKFSDPDLSTKLKLMGVDLASFGDYMADRNGPKRLPRKYHGPKEVKALVYHDPFAGVYKKFLFTADGKYIVGGMMVGDAAGYLKVSALCRTQKELDVSPSELIIGKKSSGDDEEAADLEDSAQICSCNNVTKGDVRKAVQDGTCKSLGDVKSCTKAGTGCGGCMPVVTSIFNREMKAMGQEVTNHICPHFKLSRAELFSIISVKKLKTFDEVMKECGTDPNSIGCESCKPTLGSIFATLYNKLVMSTPYHNLQDTNDKFLANIQRNGTFSVIPRVSAGEITPEKLVTIGQVARKYNLYTKITGGQRIDMFGAKKEDLPSIWEELINAGFESGHAYGKSLRTVKSCVGTTWCRFGIGDSVGLAVRLEERYKSIRSPHKIKGGVSGCVRECAEAQSKDFGLIATEKGFNIYVAGNGGVTPKHAKLLVADVEPDRVVSILDRFLMFYMATGDKLQRTSKWLENLEGGIEYLRSVVVEDKYGLAAELERQMNELVGTFFCEWKAAVSDPKVRAQFKQFSNTSKTVDNMEEIKERGQSRPTNWPKSGTNYDFKGQKWVSLEWEQLCKAEDVTSDRQVAGSTTILRGDTQLAVFYVPHHGFYVSQNMCPHKRAFVLSHGIVGEIEKGRPYISCPLHKRNYDLSAPKHINGSTNGEVSSNGSGGGSCMNDPDVSIATFECKEIDGIVHAKIPSVPEMDEVLGTQRWKVRQGQGISSGFEKLDTKISGRTVPTGQELDW